jgi:hypothetical protein
MKDKLGGTTGVCIALVPKRENLKEGARAFSIVLSFCKVDGK